MAGSGLGLSVVWVSVVVILVKLTVTGPVTVGPEAFAAAVSSSAYEHIECYLKTDLKRETLKLLDAYTCMYSCTSVYYQTA